MGPGAECRTSSSEESISGKHGAHVPIPAIRRSLHGTAKVGRRFEERVQAAAFGRHVKQKAALRERLLGLRIFYMHEVRHLPPNQAGIIR
jgi:hypothetical protein